MIQEHIVAHLRRFTDDNAHAVVDDKPPADGGAGVNLDAGEMSAQLAHQSRQEEHMVPVEKVGNPVIDDGVDAGVQQENLQLGPRRRVSRLIGPQCFI